MVFLLTLRLHTPFINVSLTSKKLGKIVTKFLREIAKNDGF